MDNIQKKVLEIVNENLEIVEIMPNQLEEDLYTIGMDSINFIRIVVAIEEAFGVEVPDEYLLITEMSTISKIASVVEETVAVKKIIVERE